MQGLATTAQTESSACKDYFSTDHLRSDLKTRALRGASITLISQAITFAMGTAGTVILARLLTPHDFGMITMVLTFALLLQSFGSNGFIEATVQRSSINHQQISTLFWINAVISLILTLLFMASASSIAWFYKEPLLKPIALTTAVSILFAGLSTQHQALLRRGMEFYRIAGCEIGALLLSLIVSIVMAHRGWGYWALVARYVLLAFVTTVSAWILCGWRPGLPARGTGVGPMLRFALHTYGNYVAGYLTRGADKILIGRFQGSQPLGYYDRAYHLSLMLPTQLLTPLNLVAMPAFTRLSDDPKKYRHAYLTALSMLAFVYMPLSAALTLIGRDLILLLLGPQWNRTGHLFTVLGFSIGAMMLYHTHAWIHLSLGTPHRWLRWTIIAFIFTMILFAFGLRFGTFGIAVAYSASFYILIGPALWYAGKPIQLKVSSIFSGVWRCFVSALAAGLLSWFLLYTYPLTSHIFMELNRIARMLVAVVLCISLYLVLIISFYRSIKPISRFISILREMIPKISSTD